MTAPNATYVSGDVQTLTYQLSAAAAVAVGECTEVGNLLLISHGGKGVGIAAGDVDERAYDGGLYDVTKAAGTNFTNGQTVFVDMSTGLAVTAPNANTMEFGPANGATPTNATVVRAAHVARIGSASLTGIGTGYVVARGETALDGSNATPIVTGLTTIASVALALKGTAAPGVGTSVVTYDTSGGTINLYAWKPTSNADPTLVASTGTETVGWIAIGTL